MSIFLKRIYEEPEPVDGKRFLVDRLWPRGISKEKAQIESWLKDLAPSTELRKWFNHEAERWDEFKRRYRQELESASENSETKKQLDMLQSLAQQESITLVYGAKNTEHNQAVVLKEYLEVN